MVVDGLTFNQIATSSPIRRVFKSEGYLLPKSPQIIQDYFINEFEKTVAIVTEKINNMKKKRGRFSISFDESTSVRNRCNMNLNLHDVKGFHSLSMIRIKGSMKTKKAIELEQGKLSKFNLNLDTDIVGTITDGASIMMNFGRKTSSLHIACLVHAIH